MKSSLSVVLPLRNAQSVVASKLEELLEILPEFTSQFDIVLVDDGSTDHTVETAHELSLKFPQIQLIVHPAKLGPDEALRSGLRYTRGQWLLACRSTDFDPEELGKLWSRRSADGAVYGVAPDPVGSIPLPPRELRPQYSVETHIPELLLVPRRLVAGRPTNDDRQTVLGYLRSAGYPLRSVELRRPSSRRTIGRLASELHRSLSSGKEGRRLDTPTASKRSPTNAPAAPAGQKRPPNYLLSKLKAFALGE